MPPPSTGACAGRLGVERQFLLNVPAWLAALGGIALTLILVGNVRRQQAQRLEAEFDLRVANHMRALQTSISIQAEYLFSLRNLFRYSTNISRERFGEAAQDLLRRQPGIQAFKWVPRVTAGDRAAWEASGRREGLPEYQFTEFAPGRKLVRAAERSEHFPLHYIEPPVEFGRLIGFDVASDPMRLGWLMEACDSGEPSVSQRIVLSPAPRPQASVTAIAPVFRPGSEPQTREARHENLIGFVLGMFRVGDGAENALRGIPFGGLDVLVVDDSATGTNRFLYYHSTQRDTAHLPSEAELRAGLYREERLPMSPQRTWLVLFRPTSEFLASMASWQPAIAMSTGLAFTFLLTAYLVAARKRSQQVEALVQLRTNALQEANRHLEEEVRERGQAEQALRSSERRLRTLLEVSPDAIVLMSNGQIAFVNAAAVRLFRASGPEQLIGRAPSSLLPHDPVGALERRAWTAGDWEARVAVTEQRIACFDGSAADVEVAAAPFHDGGNQAVLAVLRDVTSRKQVEEERFKLNRKLQESAKLESLGIMAGGIAHDFNNLLTAILCNASLAKAEVGDRPTAAEYLTHVEAASLRAAELCKQMLAYSGKGRFLVEVLDLSEIVRESLDLLRVSISKKVTLDLKLTERLPCVRADATQIRQVLMNLVINASEAITESGTIAISTGVMVIDPDAWSGAVHVPDIVKGKYVYLEVTDTGCGMPAETLNRIFDPFFTTKFTGRGLGLAAVLGIVRGHQGALQVSSQIGAGSTFRMFLPVIDEVAVAKTTANGPLPDWRGSGTVLVVDDEEAVRRVAAQMLQRLGFEARIARDGHEALQIFEENPNTFDAVLLDLTMPRLDGSETLEGLLRLRPDVRVVLMSGFDRQETVAKFAGRPVAGFLQKPFDAQALRLQLRQALSHRAAAA